MTTSYSNTAAYRATFFTLMVLPLFLIACGGASASKFTPAAPPAPAPAAVCANTASPHPHAVIGLQLFYANDAQSWNWMDELHVSWARIELRWDWFEPLDSQYDWSYIDSVMLKARAHNAKLLLLFNHAPQWATRNVEDFAVRSARAASVLAQRYRFDAWEIFNEPNLPGYGWPAFAGDAKNSARIYGQTLALTSAAIRKTDPTTFIVSAGLSPQNDPESYTRWLVQSTPAECYDAIGLHPYGQQGRFANIQSNLALLLQQEKRPQKAVWFTEYGTNDNLLRSSLIQQLSIERAEVPILFWFTERDIDSGDGSYGLRRLDGSPKNDYLQFQLLTK